MKDLINHMFQVSSSLKDSKQKKILLDLCAQIKLVHEEIEDEKDQIQAEKNMLNAFHNDTVNDLEEAYKKLLIQKKIIETYSIEQNTKLEELKFAYNELEQFTKIASHDLKEPLRAIANFSQLLKVKYKKKLNGDGLTYLDYIIDGAFQLDATFNDFLKYLQIGINNQNLKITDFNKLLNHLKIKLKYVLKEANAALVFEKMPSIMVCAPMIYKLFNELVNNAIKFKSAEDLVIHISAQKIDEDFFLFKVTDNGLGLNTKLHDKLFLPFQRFVRKGEAHRPIGLAMCKKIVKMHQGDIWYESAGIPGKGTTFLFTLAIKAEQPSKKEVSLFDMD